MGPETTAARQTYPPVLILTCPAGSGHYWAELNARWHTETVARPRMQKWCPEHQLERQESTSRKLSDKARGRWRDKPIPPKRVCMNPDPEHHRAGALLPASKFYRRHESRSDGSTRFTIDSRCKACRRAETRANRLAHKDDPVWQEMNRRRIQNQAAKRKAGRAALRAERDKRLEFEPFREWLEGLPLNGELSTLSVASGLEASTLANFLHNGQKQYVSLSIVDRVGLEAGFPGLVALLYE